MGAVKQVWQSYRKNMLPKEIPQARLEQCERDFCAGIHAMLQMSVEITEAIEIEAIQKELMEFVAGDQARLQARIKTAELMAQGRCPNDGKLHLGNDCPLCGWKVVN